MNKDSIQESRKVESLEELAYEFKIELSALIRTWKSIQPDLQTDAKIMLGDDEKLELANMLFEDNQEKSKSNNNLKFAFFLMHQAESLIKDEIELLIEEKAKQNKDLINQTKALRARNTVLNASERLNKLLDNPGMKKAVELLEKQAKEITEKEKKARE